jgi:hypothetical protein
MARQVQQDQQVRVQLLAVQVVEHHINPLNITLRAVTITTPILACMLQQVIQELLEQTVQQV